MPIWGEHIVHSRGSFRFGRNRNPLRRVGFILRQSFEFSEVGATDVGIRAIPRSVPTSPSYNTY